MPPATLTIEQIRSPIRRPSDQRNPLIGLRLSPWTREQNDDQFRYTSRLGCRLSSKSTQLSNCANSEFHFIVAGGHVRSVRRRATSIAQATDPGVSGSS
jgi:hypothetical protein